MNVQTPIVAAILTQDGQAKFTSPVDRARQESGKQLVFEADEVTYLLAVEREYAGKTIVYLPLGDDFLRASNITKEKVCVLWEKLNKNQPDDKYTKTKKALKGKPVTSLEKLPISLAKFKAVNVFLAGSKKLALKPGAVIHSRAVAVEPTQNVAKVNMPKAVAWESEKSRNAVYPLLDRFVEGMPSEEFDLFKSEKISANGWSLWTTDKPTVDVATLCVRSQRVAHAMVECLKSNAIEARVSQENGAPRTYVTVRIDLDALPTSDAIKLSNESLIKEYKRLASSAGDSAVDSAVKKMSSLSI